MELPRYIYIRAPGTLSSGLPSWDLSIIIISKSTRTEVNDDVPIMRGMWIGLKLLHARNNWQ